MDCTNNFKIFNNVYGILDTTYLVHFVFGMSPFCRVKMKKGNIYSNMSWKKYLISGCYSIFISVGVALVVTEELFYKNLSTSDTIINIYINSQLLIFGLFTVNIFAVKAGTLLKAYRNCYNADKALQELGWKLNYKTVYRFAVLASASAGIFAVMNTVLYLVFRKGVIALIRFSFVYSFPCFLTVIPVHHFFMLGTVALDRLKLVNDYLTGDFSTLTRRQIEFNLVAIADIHSELCSAINNVMKSSPFCILMFYFFTYLQFSSLLLGVLDIVYIKPDVDTYIWNVITILTTIGVLILATLLKHEAKKTSYILCVLTPAFFDDCIGTRRNTFLLQMLHQNIDLRIYGTFEIHLGRVLSVTFPVGILRFSFISILISGLASFSKFTNVCYPV